jgi:predicted DNA-binding protein
MGLNGMSARTAEKDCDDLKKKKGINRFVLRVPAELLQGLEKISRKNKRSMNAEILSMIDHHIQEHENYVDDGAAGHLHLDAVFLERLQSMPTQKIKALLALLE